MKYISKSRQTTAIAVVIAIISIAMFILLFLGEITMQEMLSGWSGLGVLSGILLGLFSGDAKEVHKNSDFNEPEI